MQADFERSRPASFSGLSRVATQVRRAMVGSMRLVCILLIFLCAALPAFARDLEGYRELTRDERRYVLRELPNPYYPFAARKKFLQVVGALRVFVEPDGKVPKVIIARYSGNGELMEFARDYVLKHWNGRIKPSKPGTKFWFEFPITFVITGKEGDLLKFVRQERANDHPDRRVLERLVTPKADSRKAKVPLGLDESAYERLSPLEVRRRFATRIIGPAAKYGPVLPAKSRMVVRVFVQANGRVAAVGLIQSCGDAQLDRQAQERLSKNRFARAARPWAMELESRNITGTAPRR